MQVKGYYVEHFDCHLAGAKPSRCFVGQVGCWFGKYPFTCMPPLRRLVAIDLNDRRNGEPVYVRYGAPKVEELIMVS